jgi:hypothetical protein
LQVFADASAEKTPHRHQQENTHNWGSNNKATVNMHPIFSIALGAITPLFQPSLAAAGPASSACPCALPPPSPASCCKCCLLLLRGLHPTFHADVLRHQLVL